MRVLMISGDPHLLEAGTPAYTRLELQRAQVERLDVFVWPQIHSKWQIWRAMREHKYDVITVQDPFWRGALGLKLSFLTRVRLNVQVHTDLSGQAYVRHILAQIVLRHADSIRVVSEKIREQVIRMGVRARVHVLPIYVELEAFRVLEKKPHTQKTILWIGRLEKEKDPLTALEVFKQVRESGIDAKLVMLGEGSLEQEVRARLSDLSVELHGWKDSILPYMEVADVVLSTSPYESWGASIVEALAAGVPVVAPNVGIAKEAGAIVVPRAELPSAILEVLRRGARGQLKLQLLNKEEWARAWRDTLI